MLGARRVDQHGERVGPVERAAGPGRHLVEHHVRALA